MKLKTKIRKVEPYYCVKCKANLRGKAIAKKDQHFFGATHGGREIGIYDWGQDRTVAFRCPDCAYEWKRDTKWIQK